MHFVSAHTPCIEPQEVWKTCFGMGRCSMVARRTRRNSKVDCTHLWKDNKMGKLNDQTAHTQEHVEKDRERKRNVQQNNQKSKRECYVMSLNTLKLNLIHCVIL